MNRFSDDLSDFSYDLMEGVCGKDNMVFESKDNSKKAAVVLSKLLVSETIKDILSKEKFLEVSFVDRKGLYINRIDQDNYSVQKYENTKEYDEHFSGDKVILPRLETIKMITNSKDVLLCISDGERDIFRNDTGLNKSYSAELELFKRPEREDTLYLVEERLDKENIDHYIQGINELKNNNVITEDKYGKLLSRFNEGWAISDSLSYCYNYDSAFDMHKRMSEDMPFNEFRIVKAKCIYHNDRGVSTLNYDYERIEIIKHRQLTKYAKEPVTNEYIVEFKAAKHFSAKDLKIINDFNNRLKRPITIKEMLGMHYSNKDRIAALNASIDEVKSRQAKLQKVETLLDKYENLPNNSKPNKNNSIRSLFSKNIDSDTEKNKLIETINKFGVKDRDDFNTQSHKLKGDLSVMPKMEQELMECNVLSNSLRSVVEVLNRALSKDNVMPRNIEKSRDIER